ncbi:hypothetical protein [Actinomadura rugatobispora]|uniref:Uncharacterized protein n=1 Tax=Actinomadura rugatobispora TaxID=1994 RepID=A0ABW1A042_9ACTN|nr:hypothetical protein GCM10010200_098930 [Actinomadura rugatobispora]
MAGRRRPPEPAVLSATALQQIPAVFAAAPPLEDAPGREVLYVSMPITLRAGGSEWHDGPQSRTARAGLRDDKRDEFIAHIEAGRLVEAVHMVFNDYWPDPETADIEGIHSITW